MGRIQSIALKQGTPLYRLEGGRTLRAAVKIGLVLLIVGAIIFGAAVRIGVAPEFDQRIALDAQHALVIHNGPSPTCATIPNPPQHDCFAPGPRRREFSVSYLTPHGVRTLVWLGLPAR